MPRHKGYPKYKRINNKKFRRNVVRLIKTALKFFDFVDIEVDNRTPRPSGKSEFWS